MDTQANHVWDYQSTHPSFLGELYDDVNNGSMKGIANYFNVVNSLFDLKQGVITYFFEDLSELSTVYRSTRPRILCIG